MANGGSSDGSWVFPMVMVLLILYLGVVAVVTLAIMVIGRVNPRLAAWSASFGPRRLFVLAGVFCVEFLTVSLAFRVDEVSERLAYLLVAAIFGAIMAFVLRGVLRDVREEMDQAETGTKTGTKRVP
jgi:predicted Kef-type K+ transport protein